MRLHQLAFRNVERNFRQYAAFFASNTFAVAVFYVFASFIHHPDVVNGHIKGEAAVRIGLNACEYIIMVFSFFFILYSSSAFLTSRKKEFGLLTLFGTSKGQLRRMVLYENTVIALFSIAAGLLLGTLFSKLFFMIIAYLLRLESPIAFALVPRALLITALAFLAVFEAIGMVNMFRVGSRTVIGLLRASRQPKKPPVFSIWLVLIAAVTISAGYILAWGTTLLTVTFLLIPVVFLVVFGTYFLFTQGSVFILTGLKNRRSLYYGQTNLLVISQLVFRLKDNARTLFVVATLSAVVITASGASYIFDQNMRDTMKGLYPQTISFVERGHDHNVIDPNTVESILAQDGVRITHRVRLEGITVSFENRSVGFFNAGDSALMVPEDAFNEVARWTIGSTVTVQPGHAVYVCPHKEIPVKFYEPGDELEASVAERDVTFIIDNQINHGVAGASSLAGNLLVVDNKDYTSLAVRVSPNSMKVIYGYELQNWESTKDTIKKIRAKVSPAYKRQFASRVEPYLEQRQMSSLTLFIGLFVSILFFVASGSMIYLKLFTELQYDQMQYRALRKLGVTEREMRRVISAQMGVIFFTPLLVGAIHSAFALKAMSNIIATNVWRYGATIVGLYLMIQAVYFLLTRKAYMRRIVFMESRKLRPTLKENAGKA